MDDSSVEDAMSQHGADFPLGPHLEVAVKLLFGTAGDEVNKIGCTMFTCNQDNYHSPNPH